MTSQSILDLIFITNALKDLGRNVHLIIPYMPYSRMDRTEGHTVFTLKYFANIINGLGFNKITVCEPHSDVTPALLNGMVEVVDSTGAGDSFAGCFLACLSLGMEIRECLKYASLSGAYCCKGLGGMSASVSLEVLELFLKEQNGKK